MRVLVTGGTGFTGEALLHALAARGDEIYAVHRPDGATPLALEGVAAVAQDLAVPLEDGLPNGIDAVVHLAQSRRFREFPEGAADVFEVNANATVRLLAWARGAGARSFIYASSGAVYAPGPEPVRETEAVAPGNFYAVSKHAGELACEQFRGELTAHILRFFFVYGPGQRDMFLPGVLGRIRRDEEVALAGKDGIRLNPVYVDDAVAAIVGMLDRSPSMTLNVAGPDVVSIRQLAELAGPLLERTPRYAIGDPLPDVVASINALDDAALGPRVSLAEGLQRTVAALVPAP
jgi:nucleoside-diphosphate-sugar epimerase